MPHRSTTVRSACLLAATLPVLAVAAVLPAASAAAAPVPSIARSGPARAVLIVHLGSRSQVRSAISRSLSATGATLRHTFGSDPAFSVSVPGSEVATAVRRLAAVPGVTSVERGVGRSLFGSVPNDTYYAAKQARYLGAIDAPTAWGDGHTGSAGVHVAVVDSGIDTGHPDLAGKVTARYNALTGSTSITDTLGHGTFVAGTAAADTDNALGVAGIGYDTSLIGVKITDVDGGISVDDEATGIRWATDHGANIINLSLGGTDPSSVELDAVRYAQAHGVLVVAAAGNDGTSAKQYPAAYPGVLSVGATDLTLAHPARADFSSYGSWVSVAAPGVGIYSTTPRAGSDLFGANYSTGDGTSFSAPIVSGEAALLEASQPGLTAAQVEHAIVASAAGFAGQGLGAGQVDVARAFTHLPPTTAPAAVGASGSQDVITLQATTTAARVQFTVDGHALPTVAAAGGTASASWDSRGIADGSYDVVARDCTAYDECAAAGTTTSITVTNPAPAIDTPADTDGVTGLFAVTAHRADGDGLQLLVDGTATATAVSPATFHVSASGLTDGTHILAVRLCNTARTACNGPTSTPVTVSSTAVHPSGVSITPRISPNGDGTADTGTLAFTLAAQTDVTVRTFDAAGTDVSDETLGSLAPGAHTWTWRGLAGPSTRLADGTYTVVLDLSSGGVQGWVRTTSVVDTRAPVMSHLTGSGTYFYPVHDGFRDLFRPSVTVDEPGTVWLRFYDARGHWVRSLHWSVARAGTFTATWTGYTATGRLAAAGTYSWAFTVVDAVGNVRHAQSYQVHLSAKRLRTLTTYVTHYASTVRDSGGTDPSCASASTAHSEFGHGLLLVNRCSTSSYDVAFADYVFAVPSAISYRSITVQTYGRSIHRPAELTAAISRTDGGLEVPNYRTIDAVHSYWFSIATVPGTGHVTTYHHVYVTLLLDSRFAGTNDFDAGETRLRVTYVALR